MRNPKSNGFSSAERGKGAQIAAPSPRTPLPAQNRKT